MTADVFETFADHVAKAYGCRCTTVLLHNEDHAERIYSSDPGFVPATGRKRFDAAPAMARLKARAMPQKFEGLESIKAMFSDWEKLEASGYLCLVNLPLIDAQGQLQGQANMVLPEGRISDADLERLTQEATRLVAHVLAARHGLARADPAHLRGPVS